MDVRNISITTFVLYIIHRNIQTVRERKKPFNTLESGINIPPWINIAPGTFDKKNKHSPLNKRSPLLKVAYNFTLLYKDKGEES